MKTPLSLVTLTILPLMFSACCTHAQPRFWKVRDSSDGATSYMVDTLAVPASSLAPSDIRYVDSSGKYVDVRSPRMVSQLSEQQWNSATSGAGYSLWYCGHRNACWAKTKAR